MKIFLTVVLIGFSIGCTKSDGKDFGSRTGNMPVPLFSPDSGKVFNVDPPRTLMAMAGHGNYLVLGGGFRRVMMECWELFKDVYIYDKTSGIWETVYLNEARSMLTIAGTGNKLLFAGGINDNGNNHTSTLEVYDITNRSWEMYSLSTPRLAMAVATTENKVIFSGGTSLQNPQGAIDVYDSESGTLSSFRMHTPRYAHSASVKDKLIYISGGYGYVDGINHLQEISTIEVFNPVDGSISTMEMKYPRATHATIVSGNNLWLIGGTTKDIEMIDLTTGNSSIFSMEYSLRTNQPPVFFNDSWWIISSFEGEPYVFQFNEEDVSLRKYYAPHSRQIHGAAGVEGDFFILIDSGIFKVDK